MTAPIVQFGAAFDSSGIVRGAAQGRTAMAQLDRQALQTRQRIRQLSGQSVTGFGQIASSLTLVEGRFASIGSAITQLSVASGPLGLVAVGITGILGLLAFWKTRQSEITEEAKKTADAIKGSVSELVKATQDPRFVRQDLAAANARLTDLRTEIANLESKRDDYASRGLREQVNKIDTSINIKTAQQTALIAQIGELQNQVDALERRRSIAAAQLATTRFSLPPLSAAAQAGIAGIQIPSIRELDFQNQEARLARLGTTNRSAPSLSAAIDKVKKAQEEEGRGSLALVKAKEEERLATANLVASIGNAAAGLVGILRGTQGGGFFGAIGSIASLAGGIVGAINPLAGAIAGAGGQLISAIASRGPQEVIVTDFGPRAQAKQERPFRVTNVILSSLTNPADIQAALRRANNRSVPSLFGAT